MKTYMAIDAGGTYLKSALVNAEAGILMGSDFKTRSYSEGTKENIVEAYKKTLTNSLYYVTKNGLKIDGIGIATPGPFDYENGIPLMKHKFSNIYGLNLRELICEFARVSKDIPVVFMHDANAALTGEIWKGNAKGYKNASLITLGTGLGFSFSQNGEVQYCSNGGPAVSIYALPCMNGIVEDYVSKRGILDIYREINGNQEAELEITEIGILADKGDKASIETFSEAGRILADSVFNILKDKNIHCLLLGGQISRSYHHMEKSLKAGLKGLVSLEKISLAKNLDTAAFIGVLWEVLKKA